MLALLSRKCRKVDMVFETIFTSFCGRAFVGLTVAGMSKAACSEVPCDHEGQPEAAMSRFIDIMRFSNAHDLSSQSKYSGA